MTTPEPEAGIAEVAASLPPAVRRAVLMCPFNSKGSGFRGGTLARFNVGNGHMGKHALFHRAQNSRDYSGDYSLTELGKAVRRHLTSTQRKADANV